MADDEKKAVLVKKELEGFTGSASLYKCDPPMEVVRYELDEDGEMKEITEDTEYVVVSRTCAMFSGPETFIFPANKNGVITSRGELPGSSRGVFTHEEVLNRAGYEVDLESEEVEDA